MNEDLLGLVAVAGVGIVLDQDVVAMRQLRLRHLSLQPEEGNEPPGGFRFHTVPVAKLIDETKTPPDPEQKETKKITDAPEPIKPIDGDGKIDKDISEMSNEEYRRKRGFSREGRRLAN